MLQRDVVEMFCVAKDRLVIVLCLCVQKVILSSGCLIDYGQKSRYCDICVLMVFSLHRLHTLWLYSVMLLYVVVWINLAKCNTMGVDDLACAVVDICSIGHV